MGWKCLSSEYILHNKWLNIRKDKIELPNGHIIDDYYLIEKNDVSLIVALDSENRVILKSEFRYPINKNLVELPGGTFETESDDPLQVAMRELLEETGYTSDNWEYLGPLYDYPTKDLNVVHLYLAKEVYKVAEQNLDISEEIDFEFVPIKSAIELCLSNDIQVSGSTAALFKAYFKINSGLIS